jgi:hypothetical protein
MKTLLPVLVIALIFSSCLDAEKKDYLQRIEQMSMKLDSMSNVYNALPLDSFIIAREIAQNNERSIKTYYDSDTIDAQFARTMNRYKAVRKGGNFIIQKRNFLDTVFGFQSSQLNQLKTDIENGAGKRDKYTEYLKSEEENIQLIATSFADFYARFNHLMDEFYATNPAVEEKIREFKSDNQ